MPKCPVCNKEAPCHCTQCGREFCKGHSRIHECSDTSQKGDVDFIRHLTAEIKTRDIVFEYFELANKSQRYGMDYLNEVDAKVEALLQKVKDKQNIPFKIRYVDNDPAYPENIAIVRDYELQSEAYGELREHAQYLLRLDKDVYRNFCANNKVSIEGSLIVKIEGKIVWYELRGHMDWGVPWFLYKVLFFGKDAIEALIKISFYKKSQELRNLKEHSASIRGIMLSDKSCHDQKFRGETELLKDSWHRKY